MLLILYNLVYWYIIFLLAAFALDNLPDLLVLAYFHWGPEKKSSQKNAGKWAVITGATDGIGLAYSRELARRGWNVVLISRTEAKLQTVAKKIESDFGIKTKIIVSDFSKGREIYPHIEKEMGDLPVHLLINNVGTNTSETGTYASAPISEIWMIIHMNIGAMAQLTHYFMHRMHNANIKGTIVNISSFTEGHPIPYMAFYSATKAFMRNFSISLQHEARSWGINVQVVSPGFVTTKLVQTSSVISQGNLFAPNADDYARSAVSTIGTLSRTSGYFWHGVQRLLLAILPWQLRTFLSKCMMIYTIDDLKH